ANVLVFSPQANVPIGTSSVLYALRDEPSPPVQVSFSAQVGRSFLCLPSKLPLLSIIRLVLYNSLTLSKHSFTQITTSQLCSFAASQILATSGPGTAIEFLYKTSYHLLPCTGVIIQFQ